MRRLVCTTLLLMAVTSSLHAQEFPDGPELLRRVATPVTAAQKDPVLAALEADIKAYRNERAKLAPEASVAEWLRLFDQVPGTPVPPDAAARDADGHAHDPRLDSPDAAMDSAPLALQAVMLALPPPEQWPALSAAIDARQRQEGAAAPRDLALRMLGKVLTNDADGKASLLAELLPAQKSGLPTDVDEEIAEHWASLLDTAKLQLQPADAVAAFEQALKEPSEISAAIDVPDLVKLAGKERAEALLLKAMTGTHHALEFSGNNATKLLAKQLALTHVDKLTIPQWELVEDDNAIALYEAFEERFKRKKKSFLASLFSDSDEYEGVDISKEIVVNNSYLPALIKAQRIDDALQAYDNLKVSIDLSAWLPKVSDRDLASALTFLGRALRQGKNVEALELFVDLSQRAEQLVEAEALLQELLAAEDIDPAWHAALLASRVELALSAGNHDGAIAFCRELTARPGRHSRQLKSMLQLHAVGKSLEHPELINAALELTADLLARPLADNDSRLPESTADEGYAIYLDVDGMDDSDEEEVTDPRDIELPTLERAGIRILVDGGRASVAADRLISLLQQLHATNQLSAVSDQTMREQGSQVVVDLIAIYHQQGQFAEIISLLETVPYWDGTDAADLLNSTDFHERPIGVAIISALAASGNLEQARAGCELLLRSYPGSDPAYALLEQLYPDPAARIAKLDELFAIDRFEERPLIWRAELLRAGGQLEQAEALIRQAIAIDPSDGEQPAGDRMRAYAVLAAILDAQGKQADSQLFRNVVSAIRRSETADQLSELGLQQLSIAQYRQSLESFSDAYCIQSRVSRQLIASGQATAAEVHLRKAFELMPSSFGRVESHCFGCESAFEGEMSERLAEETFNRLIAEQPANPQAHYLLGYLRNEQSRHAEALVALQEAVRLDPDYLNAWKLLAGLPAGIAPPDVDETAQLQLLRLDPYRRHSTYPDLGRVRDMARLWQTQAAITPLPTLPDHIHSLPAALAVHQAMPSAPDSDESLPEDDTPASAILQTPVVELIVALMSE